MSEWKAGGYQDWLARQETLACARELAGDASELAEAADGSLADHLSVVLSARYAALVSGWNGEMDNEFRRKVRAVRTLRQDIVVLAPNFVGACEDSWGRNPTAETRWTQGTIRFDKALRGSRLCGFLRPALWLRLRRAVELRRGDHCAERLRLDMERFAGASKADEVRALEAVIAEVNQWPDVGQAFKDAFALLRQRKHGRGQRTASREGQNPSGSK